MTLKIGHRHHTELLPHVDALRVLADDIEQADGSVLRARLDTELRFIRQQLVPHMEMAERTLYPQLQQLLEDPRAMAPMEREHREIRRLIVAAEAIRDRIGDAIISLHDELQLRRILYRLFVLMRVHLAEEERYLAIIDRNAPDLLESLVAGMRHPTMEPL
jgi:hypothetical protein